MKRFVLVFIIMLNYVCYGETLYINPLNINDSEMDGSVEHPFQSWNDFSISTGNTYLQARGTIDTITTKIRLYGQDNVVIGAYGEGERPVIFGDVGRDKVVDFGNSNNSVIENVKIIAPNSAICCIVIAGYSDYNTIRNVVCEGGGWGIRMYAINEHRPKGHKVIDTEVSYALDDGMFIQRCDSIEISGCYVHDVNMNWFYVGHRESESSGDAIQLDRCNNFLIRNNKLDRTNSGNKFCFISNNGGPGIFEHNFCRGPLLEDGDGGASIYIGGNDPVSHDIIIRYNDINTEVSGIYHHSVNTKIYGNLITGTGSAIVTLSDGPVDVFNNTFYDNRKMLHGRNVTITNNIVYLTRHKDIVYETYEGDGKTADFNCYYPEQDSMFGWWTYSLSAMQAKSVGEAHSFIADPVFVDAIEKDFRLSEGSTCIDAGTDAGITEDLNGISIPQGSAPDIGAFEYNGEVTDVKNDVNPEFFSLFQNYPNPFNPTTTIKYSVAGGALTAGQRVTLKVYNILGQEVATLVNEQQEPGIYQVKFDAGNLASGIYLYKLQKGDFAQIKKLMLMK